MTFLFPFVAYFIHFPFHRLCSQVVLVDWASACKIEQENPTYVGTTHYAAEAVLSLLTEEKPITPKAIYDLESLVYLVFGLLRDPLMRSLSPLAIDGKQYDAIRHAWKEERAQNSTLAGWVDLARDCDYSALLRTFLAAAGDDIPPTIPASSSVPS
jgi:hypothetical protein